MPKKTTSSVEHRETYRSEADRDVRKGRKRSFISLCGDGEHQHAFLSYLVGVEGENDSLRHRKKI